MISRGTKEFWALYHALSSESRAQTRKAFLLFAETPTIRAFVSKNCRVRIRIGQSVSGPATAQSAGDKADWIWVGTHQDFDKTF